MEIWEILNNKRQKTGKTVMRGEAMGEDEYHLVVDVWIKNSNGQFLIIKRSPSIPLPNLWAIPGGSAVLGEDGLAAAIRETKEEIGVCLNPDIGQLFKTFIRDTSKIKCFKDVWLFNSDIEEEIFLQAEEVIDWMWASKVQIREMLETGEFITVLSYIDEILRV